MDIVIDIDKRCSSWNDHENVSSVIEQTLEHMSVAEAEVSVVLADNDFVQNLNREYR